MRTAILDLVVLACSMSSIAWTSPPSSHRVLILDARRETGGQNCRILLVEIESGEVLAEADVGFNTVMTVSHKRDLVAVAHDYRVGGLGQPHSQLKFFRPNDLQLVENGLLRLERNAYGKPPNRPSFLAISPDGQELVFQRLNTSMTDEKPVRAAYHEDRLAFVKRELDDEGFFKPSRESVIIPRSQSVEFLRVADWPRIQVWNAVLNLVETVDVQTRQIDARQRLSANPTLDLIDPVELEKREIGKLHLELGPRGQIAANGGRYAYFIPQLTPRYGDMTPRPEPMKKIDLAANPPKVVLSSPKPLTDLLRYGTVAICEGAHALFAVEESKEALKTRTDHPSRRLKVFNTVDLSPQGEIEASVSDIRALDTSLDGKYVYALDPREAKLAVIDIASGREIKALGSLGAFPVSVVSLPQSDDER